MDNKDEVIKELKLITSWLIAIWVALLCLIFLTVFSTAIHAESAIVSFNDAEQLAALQDSVVGVCDTVGGYYYNLDCPEDTIWFDKKPGAYAWLPGCWNGVKSWTDSLRASEWRYIPLTITCRRLVGVTVTREAEELPVHGYLTDPPTYPQWEPGQAIIFYEKVKNERR